ncbi:MAG: hypothetical protein H5U05_06650 [Candidatus Aminicenantes bacterium]|nr:hypothetical protein [Candidatus Aminicenantes bacterium]
MNNEKRRIEIRFATKHLKDRRVSLMLTADIFMNLQRAVYMAGNNRIKRDPSIHGRYLESIRRELELFFIRAEPGSLTAIIEFPDKSATLFPDFPDFAEQVLDDLNKITCGIKEKNKDIIHNILQDPGHREKIIKLMSSIIPKKDSDYDLAIRFGSNPTIKSIEYPSTEFITEVIGETKVAIKEPLEAIIQARCRAQMTEEGKIGKIIDVLDFELFEERDLRPYRTEAIEWKSRIFELNHEIACDVKKEAALVIIEYEPLNIRAYNFSREEAILDFSEEFAMLWDIYAREQDKNLTPDALELKKQLHNLVKEVKTK